MSDAYRLEYLATESLEPLFGKSIYLQGSGIMGCLTRFELAIRQSQCRVFPLHYRHHCLAEMAGFEPAASQSASDGLANRWYKPLTHISMLLLLGALAGTEAASPRQTPSVLPTRRKNPLSFEGPDSIPASPMYNHRALFELPSNWLRRAGLTSYTFLPTHNSPSDRERGRGLKMAETTGLEPAIAS